MTTLKPIGDRILIKPDVLNNAPEHTDSGLYVAASMAAAVTGQDETTSICRGTVVAVGTPTHPLKHEAEALAERLEHAFGGRFELGMDAAHMLRDVVRRQPCVCVGDDVLFSHDAGQAITIEGDALVMLKEDELLAVVTAPAEEMVAHHV